MKKMILMYCIIASLSITGCSKKEPAPSTSQAPAAMKPVAAPQATFDAKTVVQETTQKAAEAVKPVVEEAKQALQTVAADIDLTSSIDKLKQQAKGMSTDALKATAEKYKAQLLSTKTNLTAKTESFAKIPMAEKLGAEAQALTKDIQALTDSMASLKDRLMIYVDALKAKGVDTSSFTL
jgi:membrane-associated HD superfamily phosphohydrolase